MSGGDLTLLAEHSQRLRDEAARLVAQAHGNLARARQTLDLLQQARTRKAEDLRQRMASGQSLRAEELRLQHDYQKQLGVALQQQAQQVSNLEGALERARTRTLQRQQRLKAIEHLIASRKTAAEQVEQRRLDREQDDRTSQSVRSAHSTVPPDEI